MVESHHDTSKGFTMHVVRHVVRLPYAAAGRKS